MSDNSATPSASEWSEPALTDMCFAYTSDGPAPAYDLFGELIAEGFAKVDEQTIGDPDAPARLRRRATVFEGNGWRVTILTEGRDYDLYDYQFEQLA